MWEYTMLYVSDEEWPNRIDHLNLAGANGWEYTGRDYDTGHGTELLMKRPKEEN